MYTMSLGMKPIYDTRNVVTTCGICTMFFCMKKREDPNFYSSSHQSMLEPPWGLT